LKLGHVILALLALGLGGAAIAQRQLLGQHGPEHGRLLEADGINCLPFPSERSRRPVPPQHIKVGKVIYTVELVREVPAAAEYASFSGKTCDNRARKQGVCDTKDHIYLEAGQTLKEEQTTLLHELQHAIFGTEKSDRRSTNHQFIYQLSPKLLEVLQENPDLYLYLTASESKKK
jgi:hypothetical protein